MDDAVAKGWYDPTRVYVLESTGPPLEQLDRFAFTRRDYNMYEVHPYDLGVDRDPFAGSGWATCARARVLRCVHRAVQIQPVDL